MPELAEVEFYRKQWDPGIGARVLAVLVRPEARVFRDRPGTARRIVKAATGKVYCESFAHGKNLLFRFGDRVWLGVHLGMTGSLRSLPPDHSREKHDHLVFRQKAHCLVYSDPRMFGSIRFHSGKLPPPWWEALPPEVLSGGFTKTRVAGFLQRRPRSPVKALLLDQEFFPGIGNWMADEILWRSRLHPKTPGGALDARHHVALWKEARAVTRRALEIIGTDWGNPPKSWLFIHRWKDGGHCPRCRTALTRASVGGRTSCWCGRCQR